MPIPRAADAHELDTIKLDSKNIGVSTGVKKKIKLVTLWNLKCFLIGIKKLKIGFEQSKKLAYVEYKKVINNLTENDNNPYELLVTCLKQAIIEQQQITKKGGFSDHFSPNCFRWSKNGSYETYLPAPEIKKQQKTKDKPKGKEVPFKTMPLVTNE